MQKKVIFGGVLSLLSVFFLCSWASPVMMARESVQVAREQDTADSNAKELAAIVQHFAFISYNLIDETYKNKTSHNSLSKSHAAIVKQIEQSYSSEVDYVRSQLFGNDNSSHDDVLQHFGDYILGLTHTFGIRNAYFMSLPEQIDDCASNKDQIALIKEAVGLLEKKFAKIKPVDSIFKRVENALLYNFVSTKLVPKLLCYAVGPAVTISWSAYNAARYAQAVEKHHHENMLKNYVQVEHNKEITWVKKPSLIEKVLGVEEKQEKINPCQRCWSGNCCNGKQPDISVEVQDDMGGGPLGVAFFQQLGMQISHQEMVQWARQCYGECDTCYHYRGYQSPEKIAARLAWASRPIVAIPICYLLGKSLEDAQLPEYEHRIKEKQKLLEVKKVHQEMRRLKVNYEKEIDFDHIKGMQDLIDREMRLIVDYLSSPLRYKNSASGTRSLLLYGPPGTGKTLLARAIAKESGAPFLEITADDILSESSKEKILATIKLAENIASKRAEKSAIIYIDEIDTVTGNRQNNTLDPQRAKALSNLVAIFDGIEKRNPFLHIVIVITTNHYKNLDPALLRPGRIDRKILIKQPSASGRAEFFEYLLPVECKVYMGWLIDQTAGYSGAQIVNVIDTAQMIASYNNRAIPHEQDYKAALENSKVEEEAIPEESKNY